MSLSRRRRVAVMKRRETADREEPRDIRETASPTGSRAEP